MKKISRVFVPVCFAAVLLILMAATILRPMEYSSYFENRDLAAFPQLTAQSLMDGSFFTGLERFFTDHSAGRNSLLKIKTKLDMDVLKLPVVNTVVVTDDYLLPYNGYDMPSDTEIDEMAGNIAENLAGIDALVDSYGGEYYYVAVPNQSYMQSGQYPWFLDSRRETFGKYVAALSGKLEQAGVKFIDVGESYAALGDPGYLTSPVDNHFSAYGAFVTYQAVMDRINADTGLGLRVCRDEDMVFYEMPDYYMGSRTQMVMNLRKNSDHLTLIYPKETVPFTRCDNGSQVESSVFQMPAEEARWATYGVYMGGDIAETVINTGRAELPSILVYGDSFTNGVECIIYNSFGVMRSLDLRHYEDMTLGDYIEMYKPDVVVCIRDYASLLDTANNGSGVDG